MVCIPVVIITAQCHAPPSQWNVAAHKQHWHKCHPLLPQPEPSGAKQRTCSGREAEQISQRPMEESKASPFGAQQALRLHYFHVEFSIPGSLFAFRSVLRTSTLCVVRCLACRYHERLSYHQKACIQAMRAHGLSRHWLAACVPAAPPPPHA